MPAIPTLSRTRSQPPAPDDVHVAAERRRAWLLTVAYLCIAGFGMLQHEMWRDEWQAWMLARDSSSIADLLRNMQHEGHPPAWYLLLFGVSRFTRSGHAPQVLNLVIATTSIFILARFSRLPWLYRGLIAFGYFFIFEYGIIARSYALTALALFAVCALFKVHRRHAVFLAASLAVLAAVSAYGLIIAIAATFALLHERVGERRILHRLRELHVNWKILFVIWLVVAAAAVAIMRPPQGFSGRTPPPARFTLWGAAETAGTLTWAYAPIPDVTEDHIWNTHALPDRGRTWLGVRTLLAAFFVTGAALVFARCPTALIMYVAGTGGLLLFQHLFFIGTIRHHGHLFLVFLAALWLSHAELRPWKLPARLRAISGRHTKGAGAFVTAVLALQCVAGAALYFSDVRRPFSAAPLAARVLHENGLSELPIAVSPAPEGSSLAGALDRPVYYVATRSEETFVPWGRFAEVRDRRLDMPQLRMFIDNAASRDVVVVVNRPFTGWDADLGVREVARIDAGMERTERYVIYHVTRAP